MGRINKDGTVDKRFKKTGGGGCLILIVVFYLIFIEPFTKDKVQFQHKIINGVEQTVTIDLNVREKPSSSGEILEVLSKDSKVIVSDELIKGWVLVADSDTNAIGYVYERYLE